MNEISTKPRWRQLVTIVLAITLTGIAGYKFWDNWEEIRLLFPSRKPVVVDAEPRRKRVQDVIDFDSLPKPITNSIGMTLAPIPKGKYVIGSDRDEFGRRRSEEKQIIELERTFFIGIHEVTQEQYQQVMGQNPAFWKGQKRPVERVGWEEAIQFCRRLSAREGELYRLPTEEEWEIACRAGTRTPFHFGTALSSNEANVDGHYPYGGVARGPDRQQTTEVGSFQPNQFGLYDMHGNVWEWCGSVFTTSPPAHVIRGGAANMAAMGSRSASRGGQQNPKRWTGFRVVREAKPSKRQRSQNRVLSSDELITLVDKAFSQELAQLKPGIVIFPVVDAENRIRPDGYAISSTALLHVAYAPARRISICPRLVQDVFLYHDAAAPGVELNDRRIRECMTHLGASLYAIPRIDEGDAGTSLTIEIHGDDAEFKDRTTEHPLTAEPMSAAAGLITLDVLEFLKITPSDELVDRLKVSDVDRPEALVKLTTDVITPRQPPGRVDSDYHLSYPLEVNPRSIFAWDTMFSRANRPERVIERLRGRKRGEPPRYDWVEISQAKYAREFGRPQQALETLLKFAPTMAGDTQYHGTMTLCAIRMAEDRLADHLLRVWEEHDPGYFGQLERARLLERWAWMARGNEFAFAVRGTAWPVFHTRLSRAKAEYEKATLTNTDDWIAHSGLISIATPLGLPETFVNEHFEKAIANNPKATNAYHSKFQYMQPRWGGNQQQMLEFASQCAETGLWNDGIPQIFFSAVRDASFDRKTGLWQHDIFSSPPFWKGLRAYHAAVQNSTDPRKNETIRDVSQRFAKWAVLAGHHTEALEEFEKIQRFGGGHGLFKSNEIRIFYRDVAQSHAGSGTRKTQASVHVALARGDFKQAEQLLKTVKPDEAVPQDYKEFREQEFPRSQYDRFRHAVPLAEKYSKLKDITFTPQDLENCWQWPFLANSAQWTIEGKELVGAVNRSLSAASLVTPFGFRNAEISGKIQWQNPPMALVIVLNYESLKDSLNLTWREETKAVHLDRNGINLGDSTPVPPPETFRIQYRGNSVRAKMGESQWVEAQVENDDPAGIRINVFGPVRFRLSDVRLKSLE